MSRKHMIWIAVAILAFVIWRYKGASIKAAITNAVKKVS